MGQLRRWKKFAQHNPQDARHMLGLILPSCEALYGHGPQAQAEILKKDPRCKELYDFLREHRNRLSLPDEDLAYVAFVLKICYGLIVRAESDRT